MNFGIHPNSGIARELSEAIDYIFRRRMDAVLDPALSSPRDPLLDADTHPEVQQ